jgi:thiamine-phosphate pyrophosphorylase
LTLPGALLLVTERRLAHRPMPQLVAQCGREGLSWVWLRDKDLAPAERRAYAEAVRDALPRDATLTIGADVELARALGARGAHLAETDDPATARARLGPGALIGASVHSLESAERLFDRGADYVTLSPIWETPTKPDYGPALGVRVVERAARWGPVVALGGVTPERARLCLQAGAQAVAVMGGLSGARDPGAATRAYLSAMKAANAP